MKLGHPTPPPSPLPAWRGEPLVIPVTLLGGGGKEGRRRGGVRVSKLVFETKKVDLTSLTYTVWNKATVKRAADMNVTKTRKLRRIFTTVQLIVQ